MLEMNLCFVCRQNKDTEEIIDEYEQSSNQNLININYFIELS
jgi:hypothetical protein